jgi:hypothetical protein
LKFTGLRTDHLTEKLVAIDDVPYVVIEAYHGDGYLNVLLDRPLDQPATHASILTGGRTDTSKLRWGVKLGGLTVVAPNYVAKEVPGNERKCYERHGINVRETRRRDNGTTQVTFDVMLGININPELCWRQ